MAKSTNVERTRRINAALALIEGEGSARGAAAALAGQFGISVRQAYRYVREAGLIGEPIPIPEEKIAFTVKLSRGLIREVRQYGRTTGQRLSDIVTQALGNFLRKGRRRGREQEIR